MTWQGCTALLFLEACWKGSVDAQLPLGSMNTAPNGAQSPPSMQAMHAQGTAAAERACMAPAVAAVSSSPITLQQQPASAASKANRAMLRWAVDMDAWQPSDAQFQLLTGLLPQHEQAEVAKFLRLPDRKRALASRLLQRAAVAHVHGIPLAEVMIERTRGKKPFAAHDPPVWAPNFNFNVSHEGSYTVLASEPVAIVGVDVSDPSHVLSTPNSAASDGAAPAAGAWAPGPFTSQPHAHAPPARPYRSPAAIMLGDDGALELEDPIPKRLQLLRPQFSPTEWETIRQATAVDRARDRGWLQGQGAGVNEDCGSWGHNGHDGNSGTAAGEPQQPGGPLGLVETFQRLWSLKEAFIKARGDGLGFEPLSRASFSLLGGSSGASGSSSHWRSHGVRGGGEEGWGQQARIEVDGVPQTRWSFRVGLLGKGHVVSVARGPPADIVDAWGVFRARLSLPDPTDDELSAALAAPHPSWRLLSPVELLREAGMEVGSVYAAAG